MEETKINSQETHKTTRPPIVVVVGHVDHGKTTILDWYRKTKVTEEEIGGITQHIGAYEVEHDGKKLTFIDTPGHEAFPNIRIRGAMAADIAILVVAADEGVKLQTREAIAVIRDQNLPFVVAITKIDRPGANPERVKQELAKEEVLVEGYGGKVPVAAVSAKTGEHMDELLETLLLVAELEDLQAHPEKPAEGVVVEAHMDPRRGAGATIIIRDGTLHKGDTVAIGRNVEVVRILEDFRGRPIESAGPSAVALAAGLGQSPAASDLMRVFATRAEAEQFVKSMPAAAATLPGTAGDGNQTFNIILKTDVFGSREALEATLQKLESPYLAVRILKSDVGDINESDVKLALATRLVTIVGFKVKIDAAARELARANNIRIVTGEVIYNLLDAVKDAINQSIPPEVKRTDLGMVKILKLFKKDNGRQVVGGRVERGLIRKGAKVEIIRNRMPIDMGTIAELQRERQAAEEVGEGAECGILVESKMPLATGDTLVIFEEQLIRHGL